MKQYPTVYWQMKKMLEACTKFRHRDTKYFDMLANVLRDKIDLMEAEHLDDSYAGDPNGDADQEVQHEG